MHKQGREVNASELVFFSIFCIIFIISFTIILTPLASSSAWIPGGDICSNSQINLAEDESNQVEKCEMHSYETLCMDSDIPATYTWLVESVDIGEGILNRGEACRYTGNLGNLQTHETGISDDERCVYDEVKNSDVYAEFNWDNTGDLFLAGSGENDLYDVFEDGELKYDEKGSYFENAIECGGMNSRTFGGKIYSGPVEEGRCTGLGPEINTPDIPEEVNFAYILYDKENNKGHCFVNTGEEGISPKKNLEEGDFIIYDNLDYCCNDIIPPIIEDMEITNYALLDRKNQSDYMSEPREDLAHEEVFPLKPHLNIKINDTQGRAEFLVNYRLSIRYPNDTIAVLDANQKTCGKNCIINFPEDKITQDSLLIASAEVTSMEGYFDSKLGSKIEYEYTPYFNILPLPYPASIKAFNVIDDVPLVSNKPIAVIFSPEIVSYLRKVEFGFGDEKLKPKPHQFTSIENNKYIDVVKNVNFDLYMSDGVTNKKVKTISKDKLTKFESIDSLKLLVARRINTNENMVKLQKAKNAEDTVNFIGLFPPKDFGTTKTSTKDIIFSVVINPDKNIIEADYSDNSASYTKNIAKQEKIVKMSFKVLSFYDEKNINNRFEVVSKGTAFSNANEAADFMLSAFPLDPLKTSMGIPGVFPVEVSASGINKLSDYGKNPYPARIKAYQQLQAYADYANSRKSDANEETVVVFGIGHKNVLNYRGDSGYNELTAPDNYKNVVIVDESYDYKSHMHGLGHILIPEYQKKEQPGCGNNEPGFGLLSDNGWCMDQKTGKECALWLQGQPAPRKNGANINIWKDADTTGFYNIIDAPNGAFIPGANPAYAGRRFPDIMTHNSVFIWPRKNPTYTRLMERFGTA